MQKNTKTISLTAIVAIIGIASIGYTSLEITEESAIETNELIRQEIHNSLPNYSLDFLASNAKYTIIGEVKQITPIIIETDRTEKRVFSDVLIQVEKDLNEQYTENEISVRIEGGILDRMETISHGNAAFENGERVLFFVPEKEPESIWGDSYYVAGLFLGKYKLENGEAFREIINDSIGESELVLKIQKSRGL